MLYGNKTLTRWARLAMTAAVAVAMVACGGGGGGGGTSLSNTGSGTTGTGTSGSTGGTTGSTTTTTSPTMTIAIVDTSNVATASNSISSSAASVRVVLKDASGAVVPSKLVTFTTDATVATLLQASALTDASGVASVRIDPVSRTTAGAGTVTATATVSGTAVQSSIDYQTTAASVSLANFSAGSTSITALQSAAVSVKALIGSSAAAAGLVNVNFSASCGTFSPATATNISDGTVSTVYQSLGTCNGAVTLTATASGAAPATTTINVVAAQPANLLFVSSDQTTIFTSRAASGIKQATLKFQVVNSSGAGMASQTVQFSLSSTAVSAGVTFAGTGTAAAQTVTTDANGNASITITSGALPTPVLVTAALASNTAMQASSSTLAITSGVPVQSAASLAASILAVEGWNTDGRTSSLTFRIADRQGNPVPQGTAVTFVTSNSQVTGSCMLDANSACTATFTSQGTRPANGRVAILAYLDGEESFVDLNGNNAYDSGETFTDIGTAYRDDNENGVRDATEQTYPGGMTGSTACVSSAINTPFVANSCDGIWSNSIRVRRQITVVLSTSGANISLNSRSTSQLRVLIADGNGNSVATGSSVTASVVSPGSACGVTSGSGLSIPNTTEAGIYAFGLNGDASCSSASILITVTSPSGIVSTLTTP